MNARTIVGILLVGVLVSCTDVPIKSETSFQILGRNYLYDMDVWSFDGRFSLSSEKNALSATISWKHQSRRDEIELAGPFGQGRTVIVFTDDNVVIDYGDERLQHFGNMDRFISSYTGISVPVSALKFWVLGLVEPDIKYVEFENGFSQCGWNVSYLQMQTVALNELPRKIKVEQGDTVLKLIISHWDM